MGNVIRIGVVGLGVFGRHHARHFAGNPNGRLVAVADVDDVRAEAVAAQYACAAFADPFALIGKVDAVAIATPAISHAALGRAYLDAGIHVLMEKPLATTAEDARHLVAAADANGVILQVGHVERFSPAVREIQQRVRNARRVTTVRRSPGPSRTTDVDVVLDMMIHDIDHVLSLVGASVKAVSASGAAVIGPLCDEAEAWITFANGAIATLSVSRVADKLDRRLTVTDADYVFAADLAAPALAVVERRGRNPAEVMRFAAHDNLAAEIAAFVNSVQTGSSPEADGHAGLAAVEVAEQIQRAIADADVPMRRSV